MNSPVYKPYNRKDLDMASLLSGGQAPQTNRTEQLHTKILALAQELFIEEMLADTLLACGSSYTCRAAGQYGMYETVDGEIISFQPKFTLNFTLICPNFVATSDLPTIKTIARQLDEYELSVAA